MTLIPIFITAFVVALSGAMMPGPLLTVTVNETVRRGRFAALALVSGHALLELAIAVALALGLSRFLGNELVIRAIGVIGGAVLLWMGAGIIRDVIGKRVSLSEIKASDAGGSGMLLASGVVTSVANPYWTLWWATIGAGLLAKSMLQAGAGGFVSFYLGHILGDYVWYVLVGFVVAAGSKFAGDTIYRAVLFACGLFLVALAISFMGGFRVF